MKVFLLALAGLALSLNRVLGTSAEDGDREALEALYQATNGPAGWTNKWDLSAADHCNWYGVTCTGGRVTELQVEQIHCTLLQSPGVNQKE